MNLKSRSMYSEVSISVIIIYYSFDSLGITCSTQYPIGMISSTTSAVSMITVCMIHDDLPPKNRIKLEFRIFMCCEMLNQR